MSDYHLRKVYDFFADDWSRFEQMVQDIYGSFTDPTYWYGDYNEDKLRRFEGIHLIPFAGDVVDYNLDRIRDYQYLDRYGMTLADVKDPRKLRQTQSGITFMRNQYNFVSDNVKRLYR